MLRQFGILLLISCVSFVAAAQDTLPSFSLVNKGNNRIIISWSNPYENIRQLSIQRSADSLKNFKSILTLPDPTVPQNGFADTKAPAGPVYYRLYILLDSGIYIFSKSKSPVWDTIRVRQVPKEPKPVEEVAIDLPKPVDTAKEKPVVVEEPKKETTVPKDVVKKEPEKKEPEKKAPEKKETVKTEPPKPKEIPEKMIAVKRNDTLIAEVGERSIKRYKDSVSLKTKDTAVFAGTDTLLIKVFVPKFVYKPSKFVFTEKDGNVKILLPQASEKKYTIKFFDEQGVPVFDIKQIKTTSLTLDKTNFVRAGWFKFELYEDGVIKEKSKLFVPKDF
ncbi:MAG: hypothetical protein QM726_16810 [Chitinophagaceae bacterium]